jgi:membrane protease YdiL (CAAX protease family)
LTPFWLDHLMVVVLSVFFPLRAATFGYRRLVLAPIEQVTEVRRSLYYQAIALQWGLSTIALTIWLLRGRRAIALGLEPRDLSSVVWGMVGATVIGITFWIVRRRVRRDHEALDRVLQKLGHIDRMLPHTQREKSIFHLVAFTAGVCEELLYRGYLIWYFTHWLDVAPAVIVSSVIFGIGHSYQGLKGILTTTLVGAVMALIYLTSGSLWPAMAVHAIVDMHAGELAYAALSRPLPPAPEPMPSPVSG